MELPQNFLRIKPGMKFFEQASDALRQEMDQHHSEENLLVLGNKENG